MFFLLDGMKQCFGFKNQKKMKNICKISIHAVIQDARSANVSERFVNLFILH